MRTLRANIRIKYGGYESPSGDLFVRPRDEVIKYELAFESKS